MSRFHLVDLPMFIGVFLDLIERIQINDRFLMILNHVIRFFTIILESDFFITCLTTVGNPLYRLLGIFDIAYANKSRKACL